MRAFIAVDLSEEIRNRIEEVERHFSEFSDAGVRLKLVDPGQVHQTLKFLGNVPEELMESIKRELEAINLAPFDIVLRGAGYFPPNSRQIRIVWIRIADGVKELNALQEQVETRMVALGFPAEKHGFSPHITICRVKWIKSESARRRILQKIAELGDVELGEMRVDTVKLKRSTLTPRGPIYDDIYVKRLDQ